MENLLYDRLKPVLRVLLAVTIITLAGCGVPAVHPAVGRVVGNLPLVSIVEPGRPAPTFTGKVTLLNLWGTWCPPCRREVPGMARLAARLADDPRFQLVAVSCGGSERDDLAEITATTLEFLAAQRLELDPWADPDGMARMILAESFGFGAYPTTYLVGPDATVRAVWTGYRSRDEADMARAVVEALKDESLEKLPAESAPAVR
jgi:thiol-disulfide isomerase/thioredoxin